MIDTYFDIKWASDREKTSKKEVAIVIDVLRGSTTIITSLALGAKVVKPFRKMEEAFREARKTKKALLLGERSSYKIVGFDFGNSPSLLSKKLVKGKAVIFSSSNFPKALEACGQSPKIFIGAFVNLSACMKRACAFASKRNLDITAVLAGETMEKHAREDLACASLMASHIKSAGMKFKLGKRARKSLRLARKAGEAASRSIHARELVEKGFSEDVRFSVQKDLFRKVPVYRRKDNLLR